MDSMIAEGAGRHSHPPSRPACSQQTPLLARNTPARALNYSGAPQGGNLPGRTHLKIFRRLRKMEQFPWERQDEIRFRSLIARRWCQRRSQRGAATVDTIGSHPLCLTTQTRAKTKGAYVDVRTRAHKLLAKHTKAQKCFFFFI